MFIRDLAQFGLTKKKIFAVLTLSLCAAFFEGFGMAMFLPILEYLEKNPLKHTVIVYGDKQIDQELVERLGGKYPVIHCEDLGDDESTQLLIKWMETI